MGARPLGAFAAVFIALFLQASDANAAVILYTQPDDSGVMRSEQPNFQTASISSASLGNLNLGKQPLRLTFTIQDLNASNAYGQPEGIALGSCFGCRDLQTYYFSSADRTLLADRGFHTFTVETGTTASEYANGLNPVYITFFNLTQYQYSTSVKSNAAGDTPYLVIEADAFPSPFPVPEIPQDFELLYEQPEEMGVMTNPQTTFQSAFIDSAGLGNLPLGQGPLYLTFTMQDPQAGIGSQYLPEGVCLQPADSTECRDPLQIYHFTDADRARLASGGFHNFTVLTGTTTSVYADGTRPVSIGFFQLSQFQHGTKVKSNASGTLPAVRIYGVPAAPPQPSGVSSVLFLPGMQASRLYMMNEFQDMERQLWEPSIWTDIPELAMRADGTSVNEIYTKEIIHDLYDNTLAGGKIKSALGDRTEIYDSFARFMDSLVASTTLGMREWRSYPYDWRYDPIDVVINGTLTKLANGAIERVFLEDVITELAATSATGKVAIIAHSNGGLVAKALLMKLEEEGKTHLVDQLIMIGTPQWGTPVDIGATLHGDNLNIGAGFVIYAPEARAAVATMPDIYALLPSRKYFERIAEPVATFKDQGMSAPYYRAFPNGITSFADLSAFVTDALGLNALITDPAPLNIPYALSPTLLANADATHDLLDNWTPPSTLKVTTIAGWGQLTVYSYEYSEHVGHRFCFNLFQGFSCKQEPSFIHTPKLTEDGDGTVVSPSAVGDTADKWHFNVTKFGDEIGDYYVHQRILNAPPVLDLITALLEDSETNSVYITPSQPITTKNALTMLATYSPVNVSVQDQSGNQTGIVPVPESEGLFITLEDIPHSTVVTSGEEKFVYLPSGSQYAVTATGHASGPATIEINQIDMAGEAVSTTAIADIPVTASTTITLSLDASGAPSVAAIDFDGDIVTDLTIMPMTGTTTSFTAATDPLDYLAYMQNAVEGMDLDRSVEKQLLKHLERIQDLIQRDVRQEEDEENEDNDEDEDDEREKSSTERILREIEKLERYIEKQERVWERNTQRGIAPEESAQLTDMINVLRSLI